jgi:hypothetical protein
VEAGRHGVAARRNLNRAARYMSLKDSISMLAGKLFFDRPARKQSLPEHASALRRSGEELMARLSASSGDPRSAARLRHVIGIERWSQARLRVFLGEPFVAGGHRPFLPPEESSWEQLVREFAATRAETVALAERIAAAAPTRAVNHDQFGELTAHGWMRYADGHAARELRGVRSPGQ